MKNLKQQMLIRLGDIMRLMYLFYKRGVEKTWYVKPFTEIMIKKAFKKEWKDYMAAQKAAQERAKKGIVKGMKA